MLGVMLSFVLPQSFQSRPQPSSKLSIITLEPSNHSTCTQTAHSIPAASLQILSIEETQSGIPSVMSDEDQKLMEQISLLAGKSFPTGAT